LAPDFAPEPAPYDGANNFAPEWETILYRENNGGMDYDF
jgi:hypothetical protein